MRSWVSMYVLLPGNMKAWQGTWCAQTAVWPICTPMQLRRSSQSLSGTSPAPLMHHQLLPEQTCELSWHNHCSYLP